ncbi:type III secretion system stator protein SctL [Aquabacterium sp. A7-Y]|uniref:type III secretion system stator protein SctL n=1 Tax=Aquabacterium sp. A7-Y TaxID=1349605 RepID=UPI00223DB5B3|nr:type III secretion system stator protein SctL [Aquabacterium sp. A7-Y]MCW7540287.1 type III secretion system stator protein SctL [Aquabacterium sp. A7-Y]
MLIWLKPGPAGPAGVPYGILKAATVQTTLRLNKAREDLEAQRQRVLATAREEAQALLAAAGEEAVRLHAESRERGYQDGLRQAALDWHEQQTGQSLQQARSVQTLHARLAELVTSAVERIVHTEQRGALYQRALKNVQQLTRGATSLTLRVGPADYEEAQDGIAALSSLAMDGLSVEVQVDAALRPGSCIFESELGVLDASLQTQLDGLRAAMERAVQRAVADGSPDTP